MYTMVMFHAVLGRTPMSATSVGQPPQLRIQRRRPSLPVIQMALLALLKVHAVLATAMVAIAAQQMHRQRRHP